MSHCWAESFTGNANLSTGSNTTTVAATDGANNTQTNTYKVLVNGTSSQSLTYDSDGNLTNDGTNSYKWDAENRLIQVTYPGTNNYSTFTYDGAGHCAKVVETANGTTTSTKQFIWCGDQMCEVRNASGAITSQYFSQGETIGGTKYYYTKDYPGSIRELTNSSGVIQAQYSYDLYGQVTKLQGSQASDFQYASYYYHGPSNLYLTLNRAYSTNLGRWINRDPIGEDGGVNLYAYVQNNPITFVDPLGLRTLKGHCEVNTTPGNFGPRSVSGPPSLTSSVSLTPPLFLIPILWPDDSTDNSPIGGYGPILIPKIPPGVSLSNNIQMAESHPGDYWWFYQQFHNKGPQDYKQVNNIYTPFGNFNYGASAAAAGIPLWVALRVAGYAQQAAQTSNPRFGQWWGNSPYGDDPADQALIVQGYGYYLSIVR